MGEVSPGQIDRAALERIIQRAAELQTAEREISDTLTSDELLALGREVGIPVINTQAVGIRFAELMVSSKTVHSRTAYPWAPGLEPDAVSNRAARS